MKNNKLWMMVGILSIIGGVFGLFNPLAATLTAEMLTGWVFFLTGAIAFFAAFTENSWAGKIWTMLIGIAALFIGANLLFHPLAGIMALTMIVGLLFLVSGISKIILSFGLRGTMVFWPILVSGLVSLILGTMVLNNYPESAVSILGVILSIELIFNGIGLISMSRTMPNKIIA